MKRLYTIEYYYFDSPLVTHVHSTRVLDEHIKMYRRFLDDGNIRVLSVSDYPADVVCHV